MKEPINNEKFLDVLANSGMNLKAFSEFFDIPYRTLQGWKAGERKCPDYLLNLMQYKLENEREQA